MRSQRTFVGEWVHTGDMYLRDVDGSRYFHGRNDDMFKVGGTWVSPLVLQLVLLAHEAVLAAAVVGHKDNDGLLKPKAFVVNVLAELREFRDRASDARRDRARSIQRCSRRRCETCRPRAAPAD